MFRFNYHVSSSCKLLMRQFNKKAVKYVPKFISSELPSTHISKLENNLTVVSENWHSEMCTVGLWMDIGSRCENDNNNGVAHFLEHMYFKGTTNRDHIKIQKETLEKGAILKSYMTRELISIQANCHKEDVEWAISLLSEIITSPKYDDAIVEREKKSIINEMENLENDYREVVFDYLHAAAYQGTPLGRSMLGTTENIQNMTNNTLIDFVKHFYKAPRIVLAAVGDIDHNKLDALAHKYLGNVSCNYENGIDERLPCRFTASEIRDRDDAVPLGHVAIAFQGPGWAHSDSVALMVASAINGSYDKSYGGTVYSASKLAACAFQSPDLHSFQNFLISYHDTSLWGIYYTSTGIKMKEVSEFMMSHIMRLCTNITDSHVNRAKNQLKTKLMLSMSDSDGVCDEIGRHMMAYGRRITIDEMLARITAVNAEEVREICMKYAYDRSPAIAAFGPIEGLPDLNVITSKTWWLRL